MTRNKKTQQPPPQPQPLSDYEQGVVDCLEMLRAAVDGIHAAELQVRCFTHDGSTDLRALLAGTNAAANIASHIRAETEKATLRHIMARRSPGAQEREG